MGSRKVPLPSPLSCNPSSRLCAGQKLREAEAMGRGTNARKSTNRCRGETLSYPRSDLQPIHPLSSSLTECWHHMESVGDSGLPHRPGGNWGCRVGGGRWGAVSALPGGPASPFPGQASSCQDGAQQASSSIMGQEQSEAFGEMHPAGRC